MGHRVIVTGILVYLLLRILEPEYRDNSYSVTYLKHINNSSQVAPSLALPPLESNSSRSSTPAQSRLKLLPCIPSLDTKSIPVSPCKITLVITMCEQTATLNSIVPKEMQQLKFSFSRQYNQTLTLIKSILVSMKHSKIKGVEDDLDKRLRATIHLELIILSNNEPSFLRLKTAVDSWDKNYTQNFYLIYQEAVYLKGYEWMQNLYAPCSTLRLLLPQLLPNTDTVMYIDTDTILFEHIIRLWNELAHFTPKTQVGMVRSRRQFNVRPLIQQLELVKIPAYNSGVMLMNLSRLREDFEWKSWLVQGCQTYQEFLQWADQDIMDVYFHNFPNRLRTLSCLWNFVPPFFVNQTLCNPKDVGAFILHGISSHFFKNGRISLVYKNYQDISLESSKVSFSIQIFIQKLKNDLKGTKSCQVYDEIYNCDNTYFNEAMIKKMDNYF